jgi:hypothetical protein
MFRSVDHKKTRTELVVFLTPHIVADSGDPDYIRAYERERLKVDPLKSLDAPFIPDLNITPQDLRQRRRERRPGGPSGSGSGSMPGQASISHVRKFVIPATLDPGLDRKAAKAKAAEPLKLPDPPDLPPGAKSSASEAQKQPPAPPKAAPEPGSEPAKPPASGG